LSLKLYRIDRSLFGKINNHFKKPDLPAPLTGASIGGLLMKNLKDYSRENSYVLSQDDEISRFLEVFGNDWIENLYYVRHPKKARTDYLIPADKFHQFIIREQLADMISYIRANVRVKELEIKISRDNSGEFGLNGVIEGIPLEGETTIRFINNYSIIIKCPRPLRASEKKTTYIWINEFPHLTAIIDDVDSGIFEINETYDLSFGLSIDVAEIIGVNAAWNTTHTFNFKVIVD